jgi:hypothetical protein
MFIVLSVSCKNVKPEPANENGTSVTLNASAIEYSTIISGQYSKTSDSFDLDKVSVNGNNIEVTVSYSGGCTKHSFKVVWDEKVTNTNPPRINLVILHDSGGDNCKAYITEILSFSLSDLTAGAAGGNAGIDVFSGFNPHDSIVYKADSLDFKFEESDICSVPVTASEVICGWGLYNNIWFALNDSVSAGLDKVYYKMYLQPVSINAEINGFQPFPGHKYMIGARIDNSSENLPPAPVCMAYPGPSVPVKIICITELK